MYTIYGTPSCSKCKMVVTVLKSKNLEYNYIDLSLNQEDVEKLKNELSTIGGRLELPVVRYESNIIGGFDALMKKLGGSK